VLYSLFAPWYSRHLVDQALGQLEHLDVGSALGTLDDAHTMNPLAIEPLLLSGALGNDARPLLQATRREPRNPETWYELASQYARAKNWCAADAAASRSYRLDPYGPAGQPRNVGIVARKRCHH
jgi:predicted Zn-dependent protease